MLPKAEIEHCIECKRLIKDTTGCLTRTTYHKRRIVEQGFLCQECAERIKRDMV